jgi:hypothetical protein
MVGADDWSSHGQAQQSFKLDMELIGHQQTPDVVEEELMTKGLYFKGMFQKGITDLYGFFACLFVLRQYLTM